MKELSKSSIYLYICSSNSTMSYEDRIPDELFDSSGHYLGRPADFDDKIIDRRLNLVRKIPNFLGKNLELLEIGCGNGASIFKLAPDFKYCLGIDITDEHLQDFNQYKASHQIENCEFKKVDIEVEPPIKQFDRVISFEVIEHLNSEDSVAYYHRTLKDDGIVAISVPNKWWIFETHGADLPLLPWNRVPFFSWLPRFIHERYAHARIYTKSRIKNLMEKHGFEVISMDYITAPMDVLPQGKLKDFLVSNVFDSDTTSIPMKSVAIFLVAKKKAVNPA